MSLVFDTEALLAFYLGEPAGGEVEKRLERTMKGEILGYINIINLAEVYYILHRRSPELAAEKERNLRGFGVKIVPIEDNRIWRQAAMTKSKHALSLADAFAVATAEIKNAKLLTCRDAEFEGIDVDIDRIR